MCKGKIALLLWVMTLAATACAEKYVVYIFYPTITTRCLDLQNQFIAQYPDWQVMAFVNYKDFKDEIRLQQPDIIISKPIVIDQCPGYTLLNQGQRDGASQEKLCFLSTGAGVDTNALAMQTIGVIDYLGKEGTTQLIAQFFPDAPKIRRVLKVEDLLPMMLLDMVSAILIPENLVPFFKGISKKQFQIDCDRHIHMGIAAVAARQGVDAATVEKSIKGMNKNLLAQFGIDAWH